MARLYFNQIELGSRVTLPVVVTTATPLKTRGGKPYLRLELFDGRDKIQGMFWDWGGQAVPELNNSVYTVEASASEYNGSKQLTVQAIRSNTDVPLSEFQPSSGQDVLSVFNEAYSYIVDNVHDDLLRETALYLLEQHRELWLTVPAASGVHHAYVGGTLIHSFSVAKIAHSIAKCVPEAHDDLCLVGGMLHDIGKLHAYTMAGAAPTMTYAGRLFEHAVMGTDMLRAAAPELPFRADIDYKKFDILCHIILSHHGSLEHGAVVEPQCIEAHLVHMADLVDSRCEMIKDASDKTDNYWTDKIWGLNSRCMINYKAINELIPIDYDDSTLAEVDGSEQ